MIKSIKDKFRNYELKLFLLTLTICNYTENPYNKIIIFAVFIEYL